MPNKTSLQGTAREDYLKAIYRLEHAEQGERRRVTKGDAVHPAWSSDGGRIAYWAAEMGNYDVWTIPATGGNAKLTKI